MYPLYNFLKFILLVLRKGLIGPSGSVCMCVYIYMCVCVCVCVYIYLKALPQLLKNDHFIL